MSRRNSEPVRHTCPDIDRMKSTIESIVKQMDSCNPDDTVDSLLESIRDWSSDLTDIGYGNRCSLEDLRDSNDKLRRWGQEMYDDAEQLDSKIDDLESEVSKLEDRISELDEANNELQEELNAVDAR